MLLSIHPAAFVSAAIGPGEHSCAMLAVIEELSLIDAAIAPLKDSYPVHLVVLPVSEVVAPIAPGIHALTSDIIQAELSSVACSIVPVEISLAVLGPIHVGPLVASFIRPDLAALPMLLVILPFSFVNRPVIVDVFSCPIGLVVTPLSLIYVTIRVDKSTDTIGSSVLPLAFKEGAIWPGLTSLAHALLHVFAPLSDVDGTA